MLQFKWPLPHFPKVRPMGSTVCSFTDNPEVQPRYSTTRGKASPWSSVAPMFNSGFGANSSGNHRALQTPGLISQNLCNTSAYSGTPLYPQHPPSINPAKVIAASWEVTISERLCGVISGLSPHLENARNCRGLEPFLYRSRLKPY